MNTKTETTITEGTPDEAAIAAEKATQAETAAESAKAAAATVTQQAAAIAADAQQRAAAQVEQAKAQTGEIAQWTKSQIDQFHTRLTSLETGLARLPEKLSAILKPKGKIPQTEEVIVEDPELAAEGAKEEGRREAKPRRQAKAPPAKKRRFI